MICTPKVVCYNMIWFTSDLHFGHYNIITFCDRPFREEWGEEPSGRMYLAVDSVVSMNEAMVEQWNSQVAPTDDVYVIGDVAMGKIEDSFRYIARLNGRKFLTPGNHDRIFSGNPKADAWRDRYGAHFVITPEWWQWAYRQPPVNVCHFPYAPAGDYDGRYADLHRPDDGNWLIHGHTHGTWRQRGRQIDVGIDAWGGRLVSVDEINDLILAGPNDLEPISWRATTS